MSFFDLVAAADQVLLEAFGDLTVTIHFATGEPDVVLKGIPRNPLLEPDYIPGSPQGAAILLLFVRFDGLPTLPSRGDTATVNGVDYDIADRPTDVEGGVVLKMRQRTQRWSE